MTYETAKKLKDAGFPQKEVDTYNYEPYLGENVVKTNEDGEFDYTCEAYAPSLSELIEACGDKFESLSVLNDKTWQARACPPREDNIYVYGPTPEEAVANLYLAINKK